MKARKDLENCLQRSIVYSMTNIVKEQFSLANFALIYLPTLKMLNKQVYVKLKFYSS